LAGIINFRAVAARALRASPLGIAMAAKDFKNVLRRMVRVSSYGLIVKAHQKKFGKNALLNSKKHLMPCGIAAN
jgi:hypothetical protein